MISEKYREVHITSSFIDVWSRKDEENCVVPTFMEETKNCMASVFLRLQNFKANKIGS